MEIIKTQAELERESMHKGIASMFSKLTKEHPDASRHRINVTIAEHYRLTYQGVDKILKKQGM